MKGSNSVVALFRWVAVAGLGLSAILVVPGCRWPRDGGSGGKPATTGSLSVSLKFGAVTSPPHECTGKGTVTVKSSSGETKSMDYAFSGSSSTTPNSPACSATVTFMGLQPGKWDIQVSGGGAKCPTEVKAGQTNTATMRVDSGGGTCG